MVKKKKVKDFSVGKIFKDFRLNNRIEEAHVLRNELVEVFKYDYTDYFLKQIDKIIKMKSNVILTISGVVSSGLTTLGTKIANYIKNKQKEINSKEVKSNIYFDDEGRLKYLDGNDIYSEFMEDLKKSEEGDVFVLPDLIIGDIRSNKNIIKTLDNIVKIARMNNTSFLFIVHVSDYLPNIIKDYSFCRLETAGKDYKNRRNRAIIYLKEDELTEKDYNENEIEEFVEVWKPKGFIVL
jgi:hypothetical protein